MQFSDSKNDFQIGNNILRLETRFLDQKQNLEVENTLFFFYLQIQIFDWEKDF